MAAGVLFAALAAALAASLVLIVTAVRLFGSGDVKLDLGGPSVVLLAVGFAAGTVAALLFLTRDWAPPRLGTVALAFVLSIAWPLSGVPVPAAVIAIVAVGFASARDRRIDGGRRVTGWGAFTAFGAAALMLAIAGAATAVTHPLKPAKAAPPAAATPEPVATTAPAAHAPAATVEPEPAADAEPLVEGEVTPAAELPSEPAGEPADAEQFVRDYYTALDEKRFEDAWATLTPAVQKRFGGFAGWKAGYANTRYSKPRDITVTASGTDATVKHVLVARDEGCSAELRFNVTWTLSRIEEQWSVIALGATVAGANTAKCR